MNINDLNPEEVEEVKPLNINDIDASEIEEVPKVGRGEAFVEGAKDTASFGFLDEIGAGMEAAGQSVLGVKGLGAPNMNEIGWVPEGRDPKFSEVYQQMLQRRRGAQEAAKEAQPLAYGAGQVGGAVVSGGGLARGVQGTGRLLGLGAAEGAAQGIGSAEEGERLEGGLKGGAMGLGAGVAGKALGSAKRLLPGTQGSVTNKAAATVSPLRFMSGASKDDIADYLANPQLRRQLAKTDVQDEISRISGSLSDDLSAAKKAVGKAYEGLEDRATEEIQDAVTTTLKPRLKTIAENEGVYSPAVTKGIKAAESLLEGKVGLTRDLPPAQRMLAARRYLQNGINKRELSPMDQQLVNDTIADLQRSLKSSPAMVEADDMYRQYKNLSTKVDRQILDKSTREVDPAKLQRAMASTTLKGEAFQEALGDLDQFIRTNPTLQKSAEVKNAVGELQKLKQLIDIGQLEGKLGRTGGPTAQAANNVLQGLAAMNTGGLSMLALPVTNPIAWARIVDAVGENSSVRAIEKAAPIIRSAMVRSALSADKRGEASQ